MESVCVCVRESAYVHSSHHKRLGQDVFNELEVIALQLLALGARAFGFLIRIETEKLGLIFELTLLQNYGGK